MLTVCLIRVCVQNCKLVTMDTWKPFEIWKSSCTLVALVLPKNPSQRIHYVDTLSNKYCSYCKSSHSVQISYLFNHQYLQFILHHISWLAIIVDLGDCAKGKWDLVLFLFFLFYLVVCLKNFSFLLDWTEPF